MPKDNSLLWWNIVLHKNVNIPILAKCAVAETPGYLSIFFKRPRNFLFEAGDWIDITVPGDQPLGGTVYSLSSSPDEPDLRITIREGISPFKQMLQSLATGEKLIIADYGNDYDFRLKEHSASTLIAGGVGVAPFRSMLKELADTGSKSQIRLIYFNTTEQFLFRDEFDMWQQHLPNLDVHYVPTTALKRKDRIKLLKNHIGNIQQRFYVSGPSGMVHSTLGVLQDLKVETRNIKIDDFGHY